MYAISNGGIYNVSTQGPNPPLMVSGFTSSRWQYVNFAVPGGLHYIVMGNGIDAAQIFNGTTWSALSISGLPSGFSTASIVNVAAAKQRLWFTLINSSVVAYMPTDAITGPIAGTQDFGDLWDKGGVLVNVMEWTIDGGEGPNSYVGFISSHGQVTVYQGTDPTNANAWGLVGTFTLTPPIGYRCATRIGSDIALITYQGLVPLSQALPYDPSADRSASITSRIQNAMNQAVQQYAQNFGWQYITFPQQTLGLLNVPVNENSQQEQYVMNTLTGAWCRFQGWNANVFEIYNNNLFFGDNLGNVVWAYNGAWDATNPTIPNIPGSPIPPNQYSFTADMQCAPNWFDDPGRNKRMTMIQPLILTDGTTQALLSVNVDFATNAVGSPIQASVTGGLWDKALWDRSFWSLGNQNVTTFASVTADEGKALAIRMQANIVSPVPGEFDLGTFDNATFDNTGGGTITLQVNAFNAILELGGFL
jgi:hypothetical protein